MTDEEYDEIIPEEEEVKPLGLSSIKFKEEIKPKDIEIIQEYLENIIIAANICKMNCNHENLEKLMNIFKKLNNLLGE
jgi:hypothetical protein